MKAIIRFLSIVAMGLIAARVMAQTDPERAACYGAYTPQTGQPGKDVVWVPTADGLVHAMLKTANVTAKDIVYDLGAGDGKIALAAAKSFGARAVGIEYNPDLAKLADCLVRFAKLGNRVKIIQGDIFKTDFSEATVVTLFLSPEINEQLMPTLLAMKPGTRIVSHLFLLGDWQPDQQVNAIGYPKAYFWMVPASVEGQWTLQSPGRKPISLRLDQQYQQVSGRVIEDGAVELPIERAVLRGDQLELFYKGSAGLTSIKGLITRNKMKATVANQSQSIDFSGQRSP